MQEENIIYDIVIVGAGPAGLSAAIFSARWGNKKIIILEKGNEIAPEPRGETVHDDPIFTELFNNPEFMESIALSKTEKRQYFAPDTSESIELSRKTPSIVFDWKIWINGFKETMKNLNITFRFNADVRDLIIKNDYVKGVVYRDQTERNKSVYGKTVFLCDGYSSKIGRKLNINYNEMNYPILKCIMKNGNFKDNGFKYFFVPAGMLDYAPNFPPFIAYVFPREDKNMETGFLLLMEPARKLGLIKPNRDEITKVWVQFKHNYPIFSDIVKKASIKYEKLTEIPMLGTIKLNQIIPIKGLVIIGDAAGFVEISGGSGISSSIKMAKFWSDSVCKLIDETNDTNEIWNEENVRYYLKIFKSTKIYKHIQKVALIFKFFHNQLFFKWKTKEKIMKKWGLIRWLMKKT